MNYLFSEPSLRILESLAFTETIFAFDFDGTLAPIVGEPDAARMNRETEELFLRLSERVPTAIISGRSLSDLKTRVPRGPKYLVGNHGLEGLPGSTAIRQLRSQCAHWKSTLTKELFDGLDDPGIILEDKDCSLAIHYRKSRKKRLARERILRAYKSLDHDPRLIAGKLVFNIVPAGGPHKGMALNRVMSHSGAKFAFFIGDDYTDEDVFEMADHRVLSVRVGNKRDSHARYFIRRQTDINQLLRHLLRFHRIQD